MVLVDGPERESQLTNPPPFPQEVEFVISALEAGHKPHNDRHKVKRAAYRVQAELRLFSDSPDHRGYALYTRDISTKALGFVCDRYITLSHGGVLSIRGPEGRIRQIYCTVLRCREAAPGWYEGSLYFNREQPDFDADRIIDMQ